MSIYKKTDEPIYITQNGYGDMVIMSMEIFESIMRQLSMYRDIEISEKQIEKVVFSMKADIVNVVGIFHQLENYQRKV